METTGVFATEAEVEEISKSIGFGQYNAEGVAIYNLGREATYRLALAHGLPDRGGDYFISLGHPSTGGAYLEFLWDEQRLRYKNENEGGDVIVLSTRKERA